MSAKEDTPERRLAAGEMRKADILPVHVCFRGRPFLAVQKPVFDAYQQAVRFSARSILGGSVDSDEDGRARQLVAHFKGSALSPSANLPFLGWHRNRFAAGMVLK